MSHDIQHGSPFRYNVLLLTFGGHQQQNLGQIESSLPTNFNTVKLRMRDKTASFQNGKNSRFLKRNKMSAVTANMHGTWGSFLFPPHHYFFLEN